MAEARMRGTHGTQEKHDVVVIGSGLAGLQAARSLKEACPDLDVVVVEARDRIGGRVKHIEGLAPWPVEAGPEFLHGKDNSSIKLLADSMGCRQRELPFPDRYYFGKGKMLLSPEEAKASAELALIEKIFGQLADTDLPFPDISVREHLQRNGANSQALDLAESIYANDFGCSLSKLGLRECIHEAQNWIYGDTYFILDRPLLDVVSHLARGLDIRVSWVVTSVSYTREGAEVASASGAVLHASRVIVTVPVTILQRDDIIFHPPLPTSKRKAIAAIGMSNAVKVIMAFSRQFWPHDLFDVCCAGCFLPEVWVTEYPPRVSNVAPLGRFAVVGFVAGDAASKIARLDRDEIVRRSLAQLDEMFGSPSEGATVGERLPATEAFVGCHVVNWEEEAHIRGAYSHPTVGAHGARAELAQPIAGRLFFAGEATHPGVNPCMQAALDTGARAALEVQSAMVSSRL